ncbi:MAG TPA: heme lyase CcmF/NrfE family subunit [Methylomirabilota bacterium]|jgi:cytochrome c-type biogenesis protein CcmF|nr:heme lyase CcmF/NrfE family subunit [Methylomirabilota bacterium]
MIPELGYGATVAALALALWGAVATAGAARTGRADLLRSGERAAVGIWVLITACIALMLYAFLTFDFSVRYVAFNTNRGTPFYYRITALWGALEGSIVLWSWLLSIYALIVVVQYRRRQPELYPWVLSVMLGTLAFFLLVMTIPAPPFERLSPIPPDGRGLNPLLEDSGMITHPVALYLGFTGFTVPFAFAVAALIVKRTGEEWITITRRWTIIAWYFLSLGLLIGGWWSYHVLGWGGYWAWDPVENAAFMPWLTATAFLHSVMIQERRHMLKLWNLGLIFLTFGLTLFGTFLTRSGIIGSVHSFTQGSIGVFFLAFLALVLLGSFSLLASRVDRLRAEGVLDSVVSRESMFLLNNLFLVAAAFTVFFGTVFPLLSEAVRGVKVSVGAPFFNLVNIPIFLALLFLMGVGPLIAWRRASAENLKRNFLKPVLAGVVAAAILRGLGVGNALVLTAMALVVFVAGTISLDLFRAVRTRRRNGNGWAAATFGLLLRQNRRYGGFIVHLGILVIALGVAGSQAWSVQTEVTLQKGQTVDLAGYHVRFDGLDATEESNHAKVTGTFTLSNGRRGETVLLPGRKFYPQEQTPIAAVDYRLGLLEDVYLVLGDFSRDGSQATVKLQVNRMVSWLWIGGLVLTLGAALAILPEARRPA